MVKHTIERGEMVLWNVGKEKTKRPGLHFPSLDIKCKFCDIQSEVSICQTCIVCVFVDGTTPGGTPPTKGRAARSKFNGDASSR